VPLVEGIIMAFSWVRFVSGINFYSLSDFQSLGSIEHPFIFKSISKLTGNLLPTSEKMVSNLVVKLVHIGCIIVALMVVTVMVPIVLHSRLRINLFLCGLGNCHSTILNIYIFTGKILYPM